MPDKKHLEGQNIDEDNIEEMLEDQGATGDVGDLEATEFYEFLGRDKRFAGPEVNIDPDSAYETAKQYQGINDDTITDPVTVGDLTSDPDIDIEHLAEPVFWQTVNEEGKNAAYQTQMWRDAVQDSGIDENRRLTMKLIGAALVGGTYATSERVTQAAGAEDEYDLDIWNLLDFVPILGAPETDRENGSGGPPLNGTSTPTPTDRTGTPTENPTTTENTDKATPTETGTTTDKRTPTDTVTPTDTYRPTDTPELPLNEDLTYKQVKDFLSPAQERVIENNLVNEDGYNLENLDYQLEKDGEYFDIMVYEDDEIIFSLQDETIQRGEN